jgi:DNA polymerase III subunit epsilon
MYTIVDIETTGGKPENSKITEIAIYRVENGNVVDSFVSLINPDTYIPDYIVRLTGISNDMVQGAPRFYEVAKRIVEITQDTIFVAHNVGFDYGFVKAEFASLGYRFEMPTLCTVKLSRSLMPGYRSYSLGNLCFELGIHINGRHRAGGDAMATVKLFELLLEKNGGFLIPDDPYKRIDFSLFPSGIDADRVRSIPETVGVYYLKNAKEQLIYIGKSKRVRSRILDHLSGGKTQKSLKMAKEIYAFDYIETGSELLALLIESDEIKAHKPLYNKALSVPVCRLEYSVIMIGQATYDWPLIEPAMCLNHWLPLLHTKKRANCCSNGWIALVYVRKCVACTMGRMAVSNTN